MEFHESLFSENIHRLYFQPIKEATSFLSDLSTSTCTDGTFNGIRVDDMDPFFLEFNHSLHHPTLGQAISQAGMGIGYGTSAFIPYGGIPYVS